MKQVNILYKTIVNELKHSKGIITLSAIIQFLTLTFLPLIILSTGEYDLKKSLQFIGPFNYIVAFVGAILASLYYFIYLYNNNKVNFYHSLPISRSNLFFAKIISGITIYIIPYAVFSLLSRIVIYTATGYNFLSLSISLKHILYFLIVYMFVIFCINLSGNAFACSSFILFFTFFPSCIFVPLDAMMGFYDIQGSVYRQVSLIIDKTYKISPFYIFTNMFYYKSSVILCVIYIILFLILSYFLYKYRKMEVTGNSLSIKSLKPILFIIYSYTMSTIFAYMAVSIGYSYSIILLLFSLFIGSLLSWLLLSSLFSNGLKNLKKDKIYLIITTIINFSILILSLVLYRN